MVSGPYWAPQLNGECTILGATAEWWVGHTGRHRWTVSAPYWAPQLNGKIYSIYFVSPTILLIFLWFLYIVCQWFFSWLHNMSRIISILMLTILNVNWFTPQTWVCIRVLPKWEVLQRCLHHLSTSTSHVLYHERHHAVYNDVSSPTIRLLLHTCSEGNKHEINTVVNTCAAVYTVYTAHCIHCTLCTRL